MHSSRIADLILTLKFDRYLDPLPDKTFLFYGPFDLKEDLTTVLERHGIDPDRFNIQADYKFWAKSPPCVDIYQFGGWISQQLIKFIVTDSLDFDFLLIQDCDTFSLRPYQWLTANYDPVLLVLPNTSHDLNYYRYVETFSGYPRQTSDCFVTEFMPVSKKNWTSLKKRIENIHGQPWLRSLHSVFEKDQRDDSQIWFSEFELLGNWQLVCDPNTRRIAQKRFETRKDWKARLPEITDHTFFCNYAQVDLLEVDLLSKTIQNLLVDQYR